MVLGKDEEEEYINVRFKKKGRDTANLYYIIISYFRSIVSRQYISPSVIWNLQEKCLELRKISQSNEILIMVIIHELGPHTPVQLEKYGFSRRSIYRCLHSLEELGLLENHYHEGGKGTGNRKGFTCYGLPDHKPEDYVKAEQNHINFYRKMGVKDSIYQNKEMVRCNTHKVWHNKEDVCYKCKRIREHRKLLARKKKKV